MRFAVDAHAIGRHLTGNEVYIRSLLNAFGTQGRDCRFVAYVSCPEAGHAIREDAHHPVRRLRSWLGRSRPRVVRMRD